MGGMNSGGEMEINSAVREPALSDVILENGTNLGSVEAQMAKVLFRSQGLASGQTPTGNPR